MNFLTDEKLLIVGAAGMIGSNMAQTALMMHLTPNICLYDPYAKGLEGVAEELLQCGFENVNITFTDDIEKAFTGAKYILGWRSPQGRHDPRGSSPRQLADRRGLRKERAQILPRCKAHRRYLQPG